MQKEYAYWMDGVENLQAGQQKTRCQTSGWYPFLNRYWDDRDTPRPESWVEDIATAKSNPNRPCHRQKFTATCASAAASGWDFSLRWMDNPQQLNTLRTTSIVPVDLNSLMFKMEKISPAPAKLPEITRWQTSTKRWQMPVKKDRKIPVERSTRLVCRLRPEKS